jgi:hypothetical protein
MVHITLANTNKIIFNSDIKSLKLTGEIYKIPIYFFAKYEESALLAIQELLKDPEKYFTEIYAPYKAVDTYKLIYEGSSPSFHKYACCPNLHSNYQNFKIPEQITTQGPEVVKEFRKWFETEKHLIEDKPDVFTYRLQQRWRIITNPQAIKQSNSGSATVENLTIEELEGKIDSLLKQAAAFYFNDTKTNTILKRFSKATSLAYKSEPIENNDTGYTDEEVKELLKIYDERYKRPVKNYLLQYYRMKLNPDIKMKGEYLTNLGFKACGNCFGTHYVPKGDSSTS